MKIIGIVGWKDSGKTTLIEKLIPCFRAEGLKVATVKHAHHEFDIDHVGKDSYRHRAAGANEVIVASAARWALIHELRDEPEPSLEDLLVRLSPADLVIVEGFKAHGHPKIEVIRDGREPPLYLSDRSIVAVASDRGGFAVALPILPLDDAKAVAAFISRTLGLS